MAVDIEHGEWINISGKGKNMAQKPHAEKYLTGYTHKSAQSRSWRVFSIGSACRLVPLLSLMFLGVGLLYGQSGGDALFIDSQGRVGIGTTSPGAQLEVAGSTKLNGSVGINTDPVNKQHLVIRSAQDHIPLNITAPDSARNWLTVFPNGSVIMNGGNVGIGTANPDSKLTVTATEQAQETDITQNVANSGLNIEADYAADHRMPGIVWSTNNDNPAKPKAGIWISEHGSGSRLYVGTSNNYATGITNRAITVKEDGSVGIGTTDPMATLDVKGNAVVSGMINGEDPPMRFTVGNPREQIKWLAEEKDIQSHCGDEDGCRIRLLMQHEINDQVRTITEEIYIEQPHISNNKEQGLRGWTRQSGGGDYGWILGWTGHLYDLFNPWKWVWARNYRHENAYGTRGPAYTGADRYKISFMSHPAVTTTVIIYDR